MTLNVSSVPAAFEGGGSTVSKDSRAIHAPWILQNVTVTLPDGSPGANVDVEIEFLLGPDVRIGGSTFRPQRDAPFQSYHAFSYAEGNLVCLYSTLTQIESNCTDPRAGNCTLAAAVYRVTLRGAPPARYFVTVVDNDAHYDADPERPTSLRKWVAVRGAGETSVYANSTSLAPLHDSDATPWGWKGVWQTKDSNTSPVLKPPYEKEIDVMFALDDRGYNPSFEIARGFTTTTDFRTGQYSDNRCFALAKHPEIAC